MTTMGIANDPPARRPVAAGVPASGGSLILIGAGAALVYFGRDTAEVLCVVTYLLVVSVILAAPRLALPAGPRVVADYLGDLSYPLYLLHLPTFILAYALCDWRGPLRLVGAAGLITVLAFHFVDGFLKRRYLAPWLLGEPKGKESKATAATARP